MSESISIKVITRAELADRPVPVGLDDPHGVLDPLPERRKTLLSNPLATRDDDPSQILALMGSRIVGRIDVIPGLIRSVGPEGTHQDIRTLWGSSWFVPQEYRKTMAALMIIMKWQALWPAAAVVGVSQMALPIYEKLKWVNVPMARSVLICRSRPVVERYLGTNPLAAIARVAADLGLVAHAAMLTAWRRKARRLSVVPLDRAPEHWNSNLAQIVDRSRAATARSAEWINWNIANTFGGRVHADRALFVVRDAQGADLAYFTIKHRLYEVATARQFRNLRLGAIADWAIFAPERLDDTDIVALAGAQLRARGVDAVELCSTDPALHAAIRRVGFLPAGQLAFMFRSPPKGPLARPDLADASAWRVRYADGDNFFA